MSRQKDGVLIRRAEPGDAPLLAPLLDDVGFPATPDDISGRLTGLSAPEDHVFVAEAPSTEAGDAGDATAADARVLVGIATLHLTPALHRPAPVGRITLLVVAEDARGKGVGRALVEACERQSAAAGCTIMEVISNLRYAEAHDFYRHLDYDLTSHKFKKIIESAHTSAP